MYQQYKIYETLQSDIVMLGDSITYGVNWNELFNKDIVNRGIGSDTVRGFLFRIDQVLNLKPKKVFIMGGINDIAENQSVNEIFLNYKNIINKLQSQKITPIIQSTLYTNNKQWNKIVAELNNLLQAYSLANAIVYIDLNKKLSKNNILRKDYTYDGIHLNASGYLIWKDEINQYLNN